MITYVALLRGINVSGHRIIKMVDLQALLTSIGLENVRTYIQSGNVAFDSIHTDVGLFSQQIHKAIADKYGFDVPTMVLTQDEIRAVWDQNPFAKDAQKQTNFMSVTFLSETPSPERLALLKAVDCGPDEFVLLGKTLYLYCPSGGADTKLTNKLIESKLKVNATARNWNTVGVLREL